MCAAARVDPVDVSEIPESALVRMAGNSMHVPSVGLAMLAAVLLNGMA